jgi:RimJ/RimL family protein N-acetyltransferase
VNRDGDLTAARSNGAVPSIDFGIFDQRTVLVWYLDVTTRAVKSGAVLHGSEAVAAHEEFFDVLFKKASSFSSGRLAVVRIPVDLVKHTAVIVDGWRDEQGRGYVGDYQNVDYALRLSGGWLNTFRKDAGTRVYAAFREGLFVGFSLLIGAGNDDKELYVAIRPGQLQHGLGRRLTEQTIRLAFEEPTLKRLHLKVRPLPAHRVQLYEKLGFKSVGAVFKETVNDIETDFLPMAITRADFDNQ